MKTIRIARIAAATFASSATAAVLAQVGFPPPPPKVSPAAGVIDMHVHPAPDVFGRALTDEVLKIIARENLVLATGHVHAEEVVAVTRRARELGVKNILVTHGFTNIPGLSMAQAKEVASQGAMIEICYLQFMTGPDAQYAWMKHWNQVNTAQVLMALNEVGADSLVLSTDLGQQGMMMPPDGIENAVGALRGAGVSQADLDKMMKRNPARLLGLAN